MPDECQPLRDQLAQLRDEVQDLEAELRATTDLFEKRAIRAAIALLGREISRVQAELNECLRSYAVPIHAIQLANDDGGHAADITPEQVSQWVDKANEVYSIGRIRFLFDPTGPEFSRLTNTLINNMVDSRDPNWVEERDAAIAVAAQYRGKVVVFFRYGEQPGGGPTGEGFSGGDLNFVAMPGFGVTSVCGQQNIGLFAHEVGHYMDLSHTFRYAMDTINDAEIIFGLLGNDPAAFDGDGLSDTLPDPFISQLGCSSTTSVTLNGVLFTLPRDNIMSYWFSLDKTVTPQQIARARQKLRDRATSEGLIIGG
jgi:hypothetical protein